MAIVERQTTDGIARLTLNTPGTLNALSDAMLAALQSEIDSIAADPDVRVVTLRGAGRAFCAGHDLREMQAARQGPDKGAEKLGDLFDRCAHMMLSLQALPQPVIAQVHGLATAAGCQLVATCDMAVATDEARFGVNGVNIGLFCSTPMVALTRAVPRKQAFALLTTGRFASAEDALAMGLINRVVPAADLDSATDDLARTLAAKLPAALRIGKQAFYEQAQMTTADAYAHTRAVMVHNMANDDTAEGIAAFLEKRAPDWAGP